jgi:hypothetical protein
MKAANDLVAGDDDYVFAQPAEVYLVYLKAGGNVSIDLSGIEGAFDVRWFDPRNGGDLQTTSISRVAAGSTANLGGPPTEATQDWTILLTRP